MGRAAVGGFRIFERCNMSVRSEEAHVHPMDRTDRSIDGSTATLLHFRDLRFGVRENS